MARMIYLVVLFAAAVHCGSTAARALGLEVFDIVGKSDGYQRIQTFPEGYGVPTKVDSGIPARAVEIFVVGDSQGWVVPTEVDMYRRWASNKTFHVNDAIHFRYVSDSVGIVTQEDYENCKFDPIIAFVDPNTYYQFEWPGCYYFISGTLGHCELGQKVAVEVMPSNMTGSPQQSPAPHSGVPNWQLWMAEWKASRRRHGYSEFSLIDRY